MVYLRDFHMWYLNRFALRANDGALAETISLWVLRNQVFHIDMQVGKLPYIMLHFAIHSKVVCIFILMKSSI